jgi:hypothetical protein
MWRIAAALIFLAAFFLSEPRRSLVVCGSASAENELCLFICSSTFREKPLPGTRQGLVIMRLR